MILHIEKVRATQVVVTLLHPRPDSFGIDSYIDGGIARIVWIELECAVDILEVPANIRHHHMPGAKFGGGVPWFKSPFCHGRMPLARVALPAYFTRLARDQQPRGECARRRQHCGQVSDQAKVGDEKL
jgi:hypothetical protein